MYADLKRQATFCNIPERQPDYPGVPNTAERDPEIMTVVERLRATEVNLKDSLDQLEKRLAPVRYMPPETQATPSCLPPGLNPCTDLGSAISMVAESINGAAERVRYMTRTLEV